MSSALFLLLMVEFAKQTGGEFELISGRNACDPASRCVRKCCPENFYLNNRKCEFDDNVEFNPKVFNSQTLAQTVFNFSVISANFCGPNERRFLTQMRTTLYLQEDGKLEYFVNYSAKKTVPGDKFCLENRLLNEERGLVSIVCIGNDAIIAEEVPYFMFGMIISMPFLLITFLVYALLPDRNLHQRALMFYVLSLLIAYILLVTINLAPNIPTWFWCKFLGYSTLFFFMVSFFWMNVICFDIWYTFSGGRGFMGSKRTSERRRLIFYSLYANGVPLLIVAWTYGMQISLPNECEHNPGIGVAKCFLATGWASLWYFYLEAGIVVIANITFFILTALRIRKVKQETSMLKHNDSKRHTYEKDKQKFNLYVKLLFAMGVNWSMEVISWLVNWNTKSEYQYIWYATDFFNAVYGVFIFFIFVFKKKIWTLLQRRYYNFIGRPHLAHTVTSSNTRSSHYSSTNYSTADTGLSERATAVNGRQPAEEMALRRVT
uniref:G-protein coupled receptors family 2 profile 2 domain-containing protein n=1 Tax=Dendroctonus ponderosae TaxID=77166 RepID=A0AAR5PP29_DENPD